MVKEISADNWEAEVTKAAKPVAVDFWHEQCVWCLRLNPVLDELARDYDKVSLRKLNIRASDKNMDIAAEHGIMGTPTMKLFCQGREVGEVVGFMEKDVLKSELESIIEKSSSCIAQSSEMPPG